MKESISIIGCGWLGLPLAKHLLALGHPVKGSTTSPEKLPMLKAEGILSFLVDIGGPKGSEKCDVGIFETDILVINIPPGRHSDDVEAKYDRVMGLLVTKVLSFKIPKVIFISSTSVYGSPGHNMTELTPTSPVRPSAKAVLQAEKLLRGNEGFMTTVLRLGGLVGNGRHPVHHLAGRTGLSGGATPVNLVHLDDCIEVIAKVIALQCWAETFNVCAGRHPKKEEYYVAAAKAKNLSPPQYSMVAIAGSHGMVISDKVIEQLCHHFIFNDPYDML